MNGQLFRGSSSARSHFLNGGQRFNLDIQGAEGYTV